MIEIQLHTQSKSPPRISQTQQRPILMTRRQLTDPFGSDEEEENIQIIDEKWSQSISINKSETPVNNVSIFKISVYILYIALYNYLLILYYLFYALIYIELYFFLYILLFIYFIFHIIISSFIIKDRNIKMIKNESNFIKLFYKISDYNFKCYI